MKCLVTGCAGFIGSHLADYLLSRGHQVRGMDSFVRGNFRYINHEVDFHELDIRSVNAWGLMRDIDWVFHTAAVSTTPWAVREPITANSINVSGTLNLLQAARKHGVGRFIFSSSNIVYAAPTPYRVSKLAAEGYCETYSHLYDLSTICLRYSNVFGSLRQNKENVIASMREAALNDGEVRVTGDGTQTRDFTNVQDICRANVVAAVFPEVTGSVDICTGTSRSMNEVAAYFGVPVRHIPERQGDIKHIFQDPAPAEEKLGFRTQIPFEDGIKPYLIVGEFS